MPSTTDPPLGGAASSLRPLSATLRLPAGAPPLTLDIRAVLSPLVVRTRGTFATAHSATDSRLNALLEVFLAGERGVGEAAMPPLKPGVYDADWANVSAAFAAFAGHLNSGPAPREDADPFAGLPPAAFADLRAGGGPEDRALRALLLAADAFLASRRRPEDATFLCALESAALDAWGRLRGRSVADLAGKPWPGPREYRTYLAVGLGSPQGVLAELPAALGATPLLKLKLDADPARTRELLRLAVGYLDGYAEGMDWRLTVDANAAWGSPELALAHLAELGPHAARIAGLEQPFPVHLADVTPWLPLRAAAREAGIPLLADESVHSPADLELLAPLIDGAVLKPDKAGGPRGFLRLAAACARLGLAPWASNMVCSGLGSTVAAQMMPAGGCKDGNVDGTLLTVDGGMVGGIQVGEGGWVDCPVGEGGWGIEVPRPDMEGAVDVSGGLPAGA
ncbi:enolase C-terminal domain-like protein [Hyaloraphidium curvatum]|nr:enolase C-terminal domain-like protein [Hyaloraphidium curvatum]